MSFDVLTDDNFVLYAAKCYDNSNCTSVSQFQNDLRIVRYIKRAINKYLRTGKIKPVLLLNHIISLYNLFGVEASTRILFLRLNTVMYSVLKTYLVFLSYMPERVYGIRSKNNTINNSDIPIDMYIANLLRKI